MANIFWEGMREAVAWLRRGIETNRNYSIVASILQPRWFIAAIWMRPGGRSQSRTGD